MCGLTGFIEIPASRSHDEMRGTARMMARALQHRGPDDSGEWIDVEAGLALGFRRLSIVDLSPAGHQPMASASGRYMIAFNGEVFNFAALRRELEEAGRAPSFRGHSDTEVMLAAIEAWGLEAAVQRFVGMFAIALWDRAERRLHLVRDRIGIKPLFYGWCGGAFLFGSELKALRAHPAFNAEVDREALTLLMRHGYVPGPHSIYRAVRKLPPGCILTLALPARDPVVRQYWSAREVAEAGLADPFRGSDIDAVDALDNLLRDAVGLRMVADVPLGAFLSGGVDSSTVVALMQAQSTRPVRTFAIGFGEPGFNEAPHAAAVARHLGTEHTELYVSPEDALAVIPRLSELYDEPFADSSQIPTFLVSELARRSVTVSLSGDGGDELFAGYGRYAETRRLWGRMALLPLAARRGLARALETLPDPVANALLGPNGPAPATLRRGSPAYTLQRVAETLRVRRPELLYHALTSHWRTPESVVRAGSEPPSFWHEAANVPHDVSFTEWMMYVDLMTYLPDDVLVKVDRASMGASLEARVPLLDHRVVELAWRLPLTMKERAGERKWVLRQVLDRYVPRELIDRPKMGFGVPIGSWLRGPLREWAEELLAEDRLRREGYFYPEPIRAMWADHISGRGDRVNYLWGVLMFQAWLANAGR